jgi:uncharacterized protein YheU (UPF0270 family)
MDAADDCTASVVLRNGEAQGEIETTLKVNAA